MNMRGMLIQAYIAYLNDYLTIERYADAHGLSVSHATTLINLAREVYTSPHPDA